MAHAPQGPEGGNEKEYVSIEMTDSRGLLHLLKQKYDFKSNADALRAALMVCELSGVRNPDVIRKGKILTVPADLLARVEADKQRRLDAAVYKEYKARVAGTYQKRRRDVIQDVDVPSPKVDEALEQYAPVNGIANSPSHIRSRPSARSAAAGWLAIDDPVLVYTRLSKGNWYMIKTPDGQKIGYVHNSLIDLGGQPRRPEIAVRKGMAPPPAPVQPKVVEPAPPLPAPNPPRPEAVVSPPVAPPPRPRETTEELPDQPKWNRRITLTIDDSLRSVHEIMERLHQNGITNYRFYGEAGTAFKDEVLRDMGIVGNRDSTRLTPGKWLTEYVDAKRGTMSREEYMHRFMIKSSDADGINYLANGERIRDAFQRLYPYDWLERLQETFGYHAAILHPRHDDKHNHIQYWQADQIKEDIETYETFMRAWLNIPEFKVRHLRTPQGGGFYRGQDERNGRYLQEVVSEFRPGATWDMWTVDSRDTRTHGRYNYDRIAGESVRAVRDSSRSREGFPRGFLPSTSVVLLHTQYLGGRNLDKIDRLSSAMAQAYDREYPFERSVETADQMPAFPEVQSAMEHIESRFRHELTASDRAFVFNFLSNQPMDKSKSQYLVAVDRGKQFAALVFYDSSRREFRLAANFGVKVSTGADNVRRKSWATPLGVYDRKPLEDNRRARGAAEWRAQDNGGYGPRGSRVFMLGRVDVDSPYSQPLSVVLHKTSRRAMAQLGKTTASHGCIRTADKFVDLLDKYHLIDGDFGRYVVVMDSTDARYVGDYKQVPENASS